MGIDVAQVKRCGDMSRKLRFLREQISKAGVVPIPLPTMRPEIELEDLEVDFFYLNPCI